MPTIRPARPKDSAAIRALAIAAELFAPEEAEFLDDMMGSYFGTGQEARHACLVDEDAGAVVGVAYYQPRGIADGVWDLTMIAVQPERQGAGRGAAMLADVERDLRERGARLLLVDTSGTSQYERTRNFYAKLGYDEEARVRDYWTAGDDLVIFRKALGSSEAG